MPSTIMLFQLDYQRLFLRSSGLPMNKRRGFRWGINWGQAGSGGAMLLGGAAVASVTYFSGGRVWLLPIAIAIVGLCLMVMGLMGEDGVW